VPSEALTVPDDKELARLIRRGDEAAFRRLVQREAPYLYGIARALVGNAADAEDLVQETFAGAFKGRYRGESSLRTWLVGILVRQAGMLRRSPWWRRHRPLRDHDATADPAGKVESTAGGDASKGVEARLDLATMLAALSPEHRAVIVLRELQGMTYEEMAAALGIPRGTVESRLHRAREELRKRYKGYL